MPLITFASAYFPVSTSSLASLSLLDDDLPSRASASPAKQVPPMPAQTLDGDFAGHVRSLPQVDSFISNGVSDEIILQPQLLRGRF